MRGSGISQRIAAIASTLGMVEQMLFGWVKAQRQGKLKKVDSKRVSTIKLEISWLYAEFERVKIVRGVLEKRWCNSQGPQFEHAFIKCYRHFWFVLT